MKLTDGKYLAKIKSYGVGKPQGNAIRPPVFVEFAITGEAGEVQNTYWWGNMGDKTSAEAKKHPYEYTIDNLLKMGFKGLDPYEMANNAPGVLPINKEFELVLATESYNGKDSLRVKFINLPGEGGVKETLSKQEAVAMAGFNFSAVVMAARQKIKPVVSDNAPSSTDTSSIPF